MIFDKIFRRKEEIKEESTQPNFNRIDKIVDRFQEIKDTINNMETGRYSVYEVENLVYEEMYLKDDLDLILDSLDYNLEPGDYEAREKILLCKRLISMGLINEARELFFYGLKEVNE